MYEEVNLDLSASATTQPGYTKIRASLSKPFPHALRCVATNSIARINSVDLVQSVPLDNVIALLVEWNRVLRPDGLVFATLPHISSRMLLGDRRDELSLREELNALKDFADCNSSRWIGCVGLTERIASFFFRVAGFRVRACRENAGVLNVWAEKVPDLEVELIRSLIDPERTLQRAFLVIMGRRPSEDEKSLWTPRLVGGGDANHDLLVFLLASTERVNTLAASSK